MAQECPSLSTAQSMRIVSEYRKEGLCEAEVNQLTMLTEVVKLRSL